ncbi:MAG TPA: manganese efflux pump MntP family protein [Patescibacteria group bacterium]|nr:manganese efflux pump MntP family protein [Patescibacteria group bacterium]
MAFSTLDFYSILLLAIGLAMDAFSVATITGVNSKKVTINQASKMSLTFGAFHGFMPILGWFAGSTIVFMISKYDHWVAFLLLVFVGGRMIVDAFRKGGEASDISSLSNLDLLIFSIAVSIDAVAVGLSFYLEKIQVFVPALIIGTVTFIFTMLGLKLGTQTGRLLGKWSQVIGGVILIGIGLRIVLTHLVSLY